MGNICCVISDLADKQHRMCTATTSSRVCYFSDYIFKGTRVDQTLRQQPDLFNRLRQLEEGLLWSLTSANIMKQINPDLPARRENANLDSRSNLIQICQNNQKINNIFLRNFTAVRVKITFNTMMNYLFDSASPPLPTLNN